MLTIVTRTFVPQGGLVHSRTSRAFVHRSLAYVHGALSQTVPYTPDWGLPKPWPVRGAGLTFLANPNSPSATLIARPELERLAEEVGGPLVLDEAYVDFAAADALTLARRKNVVVTRTFSK